MQLARGMRFSFLLKAFLVSILLTAAMPFIAPWAKTVPLISLILGETALIFLVIVATATQAKLEEMARIAVTYLIFVALGFAVLSFMPVDIDHKLFAFDELVFGVPSAVSINLLGIIVLNIIASIAFSLELVNDDAYDFVEEVEEQVVSPYELYLKDYEDGAVHNSLELSGIEKALLESLEPEISSAVCVDKNANSLTKKLKDWTGIPERLLIESFEEENRISKELGAGGLCQMMLRDDKHWYTVAKYRGDYLMLQTANTDTAPLLETSFRVFKTHQSGIN